MQPNLSQAQQEKNHPLGFFLYWIFSQHLSLNLLLLFEYWVTLLDSEENLFKKQWVNNVIGTLKCREPCYVIALLCPHETQAFGLVWNSGFSPARSPMGAVPQELHLCQPTVFHCFKTRRGSETIADVDPICWSFGEEGCVWMLALENSSYSDHQGLLQYFFTNGE